MGKEHRRVSAATEANARVLAENLVNQGYAVTSASATVWQLRRSRWRRDSAHSRPSALWLLRLCDPAERAKKVDMRLPWRYVGQELRPSSIEAC